MSDLFGLTIVLALGWMLDHACRPEVTVVVANDTAPPRRRVVVQSYDINAVNDTVTLPQLLARQREKQ